VIAGYSVHGVQQSTTIPANSALGNIAPITKTIQVWRSSDLRLPLLTVISDPLGAPQLRGTRTFQHQPHRTVAFLRSRPDTRLHWLHSRALSRRKRTEELFVQAVCGAKRYEGIPDATLHTHPGRRTGAFTASVRRSVQHWLPSEDPP